MQWTLPFLKIYTVVIQNVNRHMSYSHLIYLARFGYYSPVDITILPGKITIILSHVHCISNSSNQIYHVYFPFPPPFFCIQKINMYVIVIVDCTMWKPWNNKTVDEHIIIPFSSKENTKLLLVHVHFVVKTCLCFNSLREQWHNKRVQKTGLLEKVRWWKIWVFCL